MTVKYKIGFTVDAETLAIHIDTVRRLIDVNHKARVEPLLPICAACGAENAPSIRCTRCGAPLVFPGGKP
jgi:hypothetical protein